MNYYNKTAFLVLLGSALPWLGLWAQKDKEPVYEPTFNHSSKPTVEKIESEDIQKRRRPKVSSPSEFYLKQRDENEIVIQRKTDEPAKIHIQGRGTMNTVQIIDQQGIPDDQPMLQKEWRGTSYQEIDLSKMADGTYTVKVISPHRSTENKLVIKTVLPE